KPPLSPWGNFSIAADDQNYYIGGAKADAITVKKGTKVSINFTVSTEGTYFKGLGFKGCGTELGQTPSGSSGVLSFTATEQCEILSYWPSNGAPKKTLTVFVE